MQTFKHLRTFMGVGLVLVALVLGAIESIENRAKVPLSETSTLVEVGLEGGDIYAYCKRGKVVANWIKERPDEGLKISRNLMADSFQIYPIDVANPILEELGVVWDNGFGIRHLEGLEYRDTLEDWEKIAAALKDWGNPSDKFKCH